MASSRDTRNGPDWKDVASAAQGFERATGWWIRIRADLRLRGSQPHIVWIAEATELIPPRGVAPRSASASVSMLTSGVGGTDAALLLLLYELDKDIYRQVTGLQPPEA